MTVPELKQYSLIRKEVESYNKELEKLYYKAQRPKETVIDTVRDYRTGRGVVVKIEGMPEEAYSLPIMIRLLEEKIQQKEIELLKLYLQIELFIQTIDEPRTRELLRCRYLDCMDWKSIGKANCLDADYARSLVRNFTRGLKN